MKKQLCLLVAVLLSMSVLGGYSAFAEAYTQRAVYHIKMHLSILFSA